MPTGFRALFGVYAASGIIALAALSPAHAGPPAKGKRATDSQPIGVATSPRADIGYEKNLLGVRILQSYKAVLARFGPPTRIFRIDEYVEFTYEYDSKGEPTGGVLDVVSGGDMKDNSGNGPSNGMGNLPGDNPLGNGDGSDDNIPNPYGLPGGTGLPGLPGAPGQGPGGASPAGNGFNNNNQEKKPETFGQANGFIWAYLYPADKKAYVFYFNRDGRVEMISESGLGIGMPTSRGISLGSPSSSVFSKYGYPDSTQETDEGIQLFYDIKHHCQFDIVKNRVCRVVVALAEGYKVRMIKDKNGGGGGGPGRPGGGGGPGGAPGRPYLGGGGG